MASLSEQLRSLTNPEPSRFDLDEDEFDLTRAQVINKKSYLENEESESVPNISALRKKTISFLDNEDKKYAGRKITRAQLEFARQTIGSDLESEEESNVDIDSDDDVHQGKAGSKDYEVEDDDLSDDESNGDGIVYKDVQSNGFHELERGNSDEAEDDDDDFRDDDDGIDDQNGNDEDDMEDDEGADDEAIKSFSTASIAEDIEKGKAAKNQLSLWDSFLEMRIRLQKAIVVANKLPQKEEIAEFSSLGDTNLKEVYKQGRKNVHKLLGNLLRIQEALLEQNPETANILHPGTRNKSAAQGSNGEDGDDREDEEIPSDGEDAKNEDDNDDEGVTESEEAANSLKLPAKRKHQMSTDEYAEFISNRHEAFKSYRDATISKWSDKTRLASGRLTSKSFSSFDRSALAQINHILSDKDRLIKRTQLKRSAYRVLGKSKKEEKSEALPSEDQSDLHLKDYDPEIFDDDDFYHQLLRQFIEQKTSGSTDNPLEMGRQWLELQKLRKKVKRKVDTKASKGRKIRYNVHGKLVSFMAPIEKGQMLDSSREYPRQEVGISSRPVSTCSVHETFD
ncbi:protein AATF-like isoform X1 [Acropora palmata]|uniref:protein AATF-like isoform X1 n=1 Tax=Acropora palmata TaxID=6131 RepID=UPI003D9FEB93